MATPNWKIITRRNIRRARLDVSVHNREPDRTGQLEVTTNPSTTARWIDNIEPGETSPPVTFTDRGQRVVRVQVAQLERNLIVSKRI